jgi:FkbM family methyltransferase
MEPLHRQVSSEAERLNARVSGESERLNGTVVEEVRASTASMTRRIKELADSIALLSDQISRDDTLLRTAVEYAGAAASRIAIADGGGLTMVRTMVGYVVVASNDHALIASLVESGELEPGTRQVIERTLRPGDVFVDVGANIGLHTIAAGRKVGPEGRVLAFEPFAPTVALLERSIWMNDLTEVTRVFPVGLSSQAGKHDLFLGGTSGHHSLFPLDGFEGASRDKVTITTTTLDEAVGPGARVDLIKIDAEGAELDVLEGARHVLKDNPDAALIVELGTSHLNRAGTILEEWLGAFSALGLRPFVIDEVSGILSATDVAALAGVHSVNLFFAPHTGTALERARA